MKKYILLLLIISSSCNEDLTGHWHVKQIQDKTPEITIDVLENDTCYFYYDLNIDPIQGNHFSNENGIFFPGDCGSRSFSYMHDKDKLFLTNALGSKFIGYRVDSICKRCENSLKSFSSGHIVIRKKRNDLKIVNSIPNDFLNEYMNVVYAGKDNAPNFKYDKRLIPVKKLDSVIHAIKSGYSDAEIPFINYVLFVKKYFNANDLKNIVDDLKIHGAKHIYLRTIKPSANSRFIFEYVEISQVPLDQNKRLSSILN